MNGFLLSMLARVAIALAGACIIGSTIYFLSSILANAH